jgi:hypothetical protein
MDWAGVARRHHALTFPTMGKGTIIDEVAMKQ